MTANRKRKQRVRARVAKTGESYTAALRHLQRQQEMQMRTYQLDQAGRTDIGNVRSVNEDKLLAEGDLFVVADGMGGQGHGEVAANLAISTIRAEFASQPTEAGLLGAVSAANETVYQQGQAGGSEKPFGTTIAAVAAVANRSDGAGSDEKLAVANVGDSSVYHLRDAKLTQLSHDHSRVADMARSGALSDDEAAVHPNRHILTMALGVGPSVDPHLTTIEPLAGDRLLLCSDGLFNELPGTEIADVLNEVPGADQAADQLVALAKDNGGNDNITVVVININ